MKRIVLKFIYVLIFLGITCINGCKSKDIIEYGNITFWSNVNVDGGNISVTISDKGTRTITGYHEGAASVPCDVEYSAMFLNLPYGTYSYEASNPEYTWSGSIDLKQDCLTIKLNGGNGIRKYGW